MNHKALSLTVKAEYFQRLLENTSGSPVSDVSERSTGVFPDPFWLLSQQHTAHNIVKKTKAMLGSITKPSTCGDNNNRIISAWQPQHCIIQHILNQMCAELSNLPRLRLFPPQPTYMQKPVHTFHKTIRLMANLPLRPRWAKRCKHNGSEEMQKLPDWLWGCFQIHFICSTITAVCCCVISAG